MLVGRDLHRHGVSRRLTPGRDGGERRGQQRVDRVGATGHETVGSLRAGQVGGERRAPPEEHLVDALGVGGEERQLQGLVGLQDHVEQLADRGIDRLAVLAQHAPRDEPPRDRVPAGLVELADHRGREPVQALGLGEERQLLSGEGELGRAHGRRSSSRLATDGALPRA